MAKRQHTSEFRLYQPIADMLEQKGWDARLPSKGGQIAWQYEWADMDSNLKEALGRQAPEFIVVASDSPRHYWVIEAKASPDEMENALRQAEKRAGAISDLSSSECRLITAVSGHVEDRDDPEFSLQIVTKYLPPGGTWEVVSINQQPATALLAPKQVAAVLEQQSSSLSSYEIDDDEFRAITGQINQILHDGGINKRNRAQVLATLLLAIAGDPHFKWAGGGGDVGVMIDDINSRASGFLRARGQERIAEYLKVEKPVTQGASTKTSQALVETINLLRQLNIASAINSGRDVLGEFYEQFLRYANDAKELGIVMTPRHITAFAAEVLSVEPSHKVVDPACGTGGFLVSAYDRARGDGGGGGGGRETHGGGGGRETHGGGGGGRRGRSIADNLFGVEQDSMIAALAVINMIFRGDGSSNVVEGDGLASSFPVPGLDFGEAQRCLMNPPFAKDKDDLREWKFVDQGLKLLAKGGLLFAVLPRSIMHADTRGAAGWRRGLLEKHHLVAVVTLPTGLFSPVANVGTCAVIIKAHHKHDFDKPVFWAVLDDGKRTKTAADTEGNIAQIEIALQNFIASGTLPEFIPGVQEGAVIEVMDESEKTYYDLSPERHIGLGHDEFSFDIRSVVSNINLGKRYIAHSNLSEPEADINCLTIPLMEFIDSFGKGKSGRKKTLGEGSLPLISTSETNNGISAMVARDDVAKTYGPGSITVSANGASCSAFYHSYEFAANQDVFVLKLKEQFASEEFSIFLCAAINSQNWRFDYSRKFNQMQLENLEIPMPQGFDINDEKKIGKSVEAIRQRGAATK